jgi:hypothetical protein
MNRKTQTIIIWAAIAITLINLASLGTILYLSSQNSSLPENNREDFRQEIEKRPLVRQRHVNRDAMLLDSARRVFHQKIRESQLQLKRNQSLFMQELMRDNPDTIVLDSLSEEAGSIHTEIKKNMARVFYELNQNADSAERSRLKRFYKRFIFDIPQHPDERPHYRHHQRHGHTDRPGKAPF